MHRPWSIRLPEPVSDRMLDGIETRPIQKWWRQGAIALAAVIAVLSLLPREYSVSSGLGEKVEHIAAYALLTFLAVSGWKGRISPWVMGLIVVGYGGLLEILQIIAPGRDSSWLDIVANCFGVILGIGIVGLMRMATHGDRAAK